MIAPPPEHPTYRLVIEGEPPSGPRPRARIMPTMAAQPLLARARTASALPTLLGLFRATVYYPRAGEMRKWQADAQRQLFRQRQALTGSRPLVTPGQPFECWILCVYPLARSHWRKREPRPRAWCISHKAGDFDNVAKPILDACNGVLWRDDSEIARGAVEMIVGAQGEPPRVELIVRQLSASPRLEFEARAAVAMVAPTAAPSSAKQEDGDGEFEC